MVASTELSEWESEEYVTAFRERLSLTVDEKKKMAVILMMLQYGGSCEQGKAMYPQQSNNILEQNVSSRSVVVRL
eukprot:14513766-Ditylum_brightwellii.AAC.1